MAQQKVAFSAGDTFQGRETYGIFFTQKKIILFFFFCILILSSPSLYLSSSITDGFDGVRRQRMMSRFFFFLSLCSFGNLSSVLAKSPDFRPPGPGQPVSKRLVIW